MPGPTFLHSACSVSGRSNSLSDMALGSESGVFASATLIAATLWGLQ